MSLWKDLHSRESNFFKMAPGCSPAWKFPEIEILNIGLNFGTYHIFDTIFVAINQILHMLYI